MGIQANLLSEETKQSDKSWLVFILPDILCERNIDSAQPGGVSQPTQIKLNISSVAGSSHLAGQTPSSSRIQAGLRKYIKG